MADEAANAAPETKPGKKLPMTPILIGVVSLVEAAGFFAYMKFMGGGPKATYGDDHGQHAIEEHAPAAPAALPSAEVQLVKRFRVPNNKQGVTFIYDFDISIVVPGEKREEVELKVEERAAEIADRMARIVRAADPRILAEDDFATLRAQIGHALGEVFHDEELVQRVLIPRCVPMRAD